MIKFNKKYFLIFILLLLSEIVIAAYANGFIRHTFGDFLAVILLYSLVKSFINISANKTAIIVLIISFGIEFLQLTNLQNHYPFEYEKIWKLILGTSFSVGDLIAYFFGFLTIVVIENTVKNWHDAT
ncbi:DUF2809 domain-containing protein [Polaribacter aestuariivivens]|uniref:DUF2809 domain-containing protein n=1 Tax=Polaribacter aestuariivivens TaxID=2304626 RepID=A0A5S3N4V5_9FLAO|nr:DUF2809 domain-containing protein [Polaribacter aestuariivivens]TMM29524.1 DUF2809 domain-containing protein [Polaribacter aestuariivivens]